MAFGFTEQDQERILSVIQKFPEIERTIIFGSRARGNFKKASDVDLAIVGKNITSQTLIWLRSILNDDLPQPYFFDVVVYEKITNAKLKQHIDEHGIEIIPVQTSAIQMTSIAFLVKIISVAHQTEARCATRHARGVFKFERDIETS